MDGDPPTVDSIADEALSLISQDENLLCNAIAIFIIPYVTYEVTMVKINS